VLGGEYRPRGEKCQIRVGGNKLRVRRNAIVNAHVNSLKTSAPPTHDRHIVSNQPHTPLTCTYRIVSKNAKCQHFKQPERDTDGDNNDGELCAEVGFTLLQLLAPQRNVTPHQTEIQHGDAEKESKTRNGYGVHGDLSVRPVS
jgi:hypothetical protein